MAPILDALGMAINERMALDFEAQFHTRLGGTPPHLDVAMTHGTGLAVAVDSKFTGHLKRPITGKSKFAASYQDTVVGLQALTGSAAKARSDVDITAELATGEWSRRVSVNEANADVVQVIELPASESLEIQAAGSGQIVGQVVHRYNMPDVESAAVEMFRINVNYDADHVAVDDLMDIAASVTFTPHAGLNPNPPKGWHMGSCRGD